MKKLVYFLLFSLLMFTSCKKDASNPVNTDTIPTPPTLSSPNDTSSNIAVPVVLTWNESSGAKSYTLQVSSSSSFSSFVFNKSDITTTTQQIPDSSYLSVYYWRVSATNSAGTSDWSKVWSFTTTGEAAFVPQLSLPANGAADQKLSPVLTWNKVSNASKYSLQISTNSSFTSFVLDEDSLTTTSKQIMYLSGPTTYFWRVRASNSFGTKGWSETWSFTTGTSVTTPVLLYPRNGADNQLISPMLSWSISSGATSYMLQVATDNLFSSSFLVVNENVGNYTNIYLRDLDITKTYYWRVAAVNNYGTSLYSNVWNFRITNSAFICGTSTIDFSGKIYQTIKIGNQCWLKENLDVGTMIQGIDSATTNGIIEKYCYENNASNCATYGGLYTWAEAMEMDWTRGICPSSWHIPTRTEFETLKTSVNSDGNALKAVGQGTGSGTGTNTSGFSALLTGYRYGHVFSNIRRIDYWTSSMAPQLTYAFILEMFDNSGDIFTSIAANKGDGFSIRCIKD